MASSNLFKVNKGLQLVPQSSAPSSPSDGAIYYDSSLSKFRKYQAGSWSDLDTTGGGGGGSSTGSLTLSSILGEILSDEADTFVPAGSQIIDDFSDLDKGTKTNCVQTNSALRPSGSNLTFTYERVRFSTRTKSTIDGAAVVSAQAVAPKNTALSPSSTNTSVTFKIQGDVTNMFADTKKVLVVKKATSDGKTVGIGLLNADSPTKHVARLAVSGAPTYSSGADETTLVLSNGSALDLDFDLSSSAFNDQLRLIPFDYQFQAKSASGSSYEEMEIYDLVFLDDIRIPGENFFVELGSLTGSVLKQDAALSPSKQYGIVRVMEKTSGNSTWHWYYTTNYCSTFTKFTTTYSVGASAIEEVNSSMWFANPSNLICADNGKIFVTYHISEGGFYSQKGAYADLSGSPTTLTDSAATGVDGWNTSGTAGYLFKDGTFSYGCVVSGDTADLSYVAVMPIRSNNQTTLRTFTAGGATYSFLASTFYTATYSAPNMLFVTGTGSAHRVHMLYRNNTSTFINQTYWDQSVGNVAVGTSVVNGTDSYILGGSVLNNRMVLVLGDTSSNIAYFITGTVNGTPSWGTQRTLTDTSFIVDTDLGLMAATTTNNYKLMGARIVQNPSDEKHVVFVLDLQHSDGNERSTLIEISDCTNTVVLGVSQLTTNSTYQLRHQTASQKTAMTFAATANTPSLKTAGFFIYQDGTISSGSQITASLYATSAGVPTGSAIATSVNSYDPALITKSTSGQWVFFNFNNVSLSNGTTYAISIEGTQAIDASNRLRLKTSTTNPYASGTLYEYNGSTWSGPGDDAMFFISSVYYTDIGKCIQAGANHASYGFRDQESQISLIDSTTAQITFRRAHTGGTQMLQLSGHPWRRVMTWGSAGAQSTLSSATVAGYLSTNFDENLVFATACGSAECQQQNTGTGVLDTNSSAEDRSGANATNESGGYINITSADTVTDASFQAGVAIDFNGTDEQIAVNDRAEWDLYFNKPFCMEIEIKITSLASSLGIFSQYNTASSYGWGCDVTSAGALEFYIYDSSGTLIGRAITNNSFVAASTYYAIRIVGLGDGSAPKIYKATTYNGSFTEATYSATTAFASGNTSSSRNIAIGRYEAVGYFNGRIGYLKIANGSSTFAYSGFKSQPALVGHQNLGSRILAENKVGFISLTSGNSFDNIGLINGAANQASMVDSNDLLLRFKHTLTGTAGNEMSFKLAGGRVSTRDVSAIQAINFTFDD